MIEVNADATGRTRIRSTLPVDVQGPDADGFVTLSAEAVGEIVRLAAQNPAALPQEDARRLLMGLR